MKAKSIKQLSVRQWLWLFEAWVRLLGIRIQIRFHRPVWLHNKLSLQAVSPAPTEGGRQQGLLTMASAMHESVRLAARGHFGNVDCLPRSIALADMLGARSYAAEVKLGVAKQQGSLASHAWVELEGKMVAEPESVGSDFSKINPA